jgi:hypothetical protein
LKEPNADVLLQKRRYNNLVDDLIQMETGPFIDPLESLPLELWINIIASLNDGFNDGPNPINQLLTLTCISKAWSDTLLSIPSFWTTVVLDGREEDYLAKAMTSIELSGTLELDVTIRVPFENWIKAAPVVVPHRKRIRTLKIWPHGATVGVLKSFGQLPVLLNLELLGLGFLRSDTLDASTMKLMPSVQVVQSFPLSYDAVASLRHSGIQRIRIMEFDRKMVETLVELPDLRHLDLSLLPVSPLTAQLPSSTLRLPITSIIVRRASSYPLDPILGCLGLGLQGLTIFPLEVARFFNTLSSLQQFKHLSYISLSFSQDHIPSGDPPDSFTSYYLPSVKSLDLTFSYFGKSEWHLPWMDSIGRSLVAAFPSTERLVCKGGVPSAILLPYIRQLTKLRSLFVECDFATTADPSSSLIGEHLEDLNWTGSLPTKFFDDLKCPSLHTLHLKVKHGGRQNALLQPETSKLPVVCYPTQTFRIPAIVTSGVTTLSLALYLPVLWDLSVFPSLKRLQIGKSIWTSDFFEQLLIRPNDCPNLEHITIRGQYCEWDVLLLMLERRVFAAKPGVVSIKSIRFDRDLSFPLLRAISELLRGKYRIGTQMSEFSLDVIGDHMVDPSL